MWPATCYGLKKAINPSKLKGVRILPYPVVSLTRERALTARFSPRSLTRYEIHWNNVKYEFLLRKKPFSRKVVVFGGGDFNREKDSPPVFPRHTWAPRVNANVVWWFDPSVYLGDAGVCWGYGQNKRWYLADVLELIALFLKTWRTDFKRTLFYGSSGGGFTALALATMARSAVTAINPQCFCLDFWPGVVARFRRSCLKKGEKVIEDRLNLLRIIKNAGFVPPAVIFQCINAERDLETQLFPFLRGLSSLNLPIKQMEIKFYENPKGHKGMPDKEDSIKDINTRLNTLPT